MGKQSRKSSVRERTRRKRRNIRRTRHKKIRTARIKYGGTDVSDVTLANLNSEIQAASRAGDRERIKALMKHAQELRTRVSQAQEAQEDPVNPCEGNDYPSILRKQECLQKKDIFTGLDIENGQEPYCLGNNCTTKESIQTMRKQYINPPADLTHTKKYEFRRKDAGDMQDPDRRIWKKSAFMKAGIEEPTDDDYKYDKEHLERVQQSPLTSVESKLKRENIDRLKATTWNHPKNGFFFKDESGNRIETICNLAKTEMDCGRGALARVCEWKRAGTNPNPRCLRIYDPDIVHVWPPPSPPPPTLLPPPPPPTLRPPPPTLRPPPPPPPPSAGGRKRKTRKLRNKRK